MRALVTGAAGFIGCHLVARLLSLGNHVTGMDNFVTGSEANVKLHKEGPYSDRYRFIQADVTSPFEMARASVLPIDIIFHQAAIGSVPRSVETPFTSMHNNVMGFQNVLEFARIHRIRRVIYASSSSVYGDAPGPERKEYLIGKPLSPYAASKQINEIQAAGYSKTYGIETIGLRYFNVFGPRQNPNGAYAAVIPKFIGLTLNGGLIEIHGDGEQARDFTYVDDVVEANIAAMRVEQIPGEDPCHVYNIGTGRATTVNELYSLITSTFDPLTLFAWSMVRTPGRPNDVRASIACITRAQSELGYRPTYTIQSALEEMKCFYQ